MTDIVVRCSPPRFFQLSKRPRLRIEEPSTSSDTDLAEAPPVWSAAQGYAAGAADVDPLIEWLHDSLGTEALLAIAELAGRSKSRLFLTGDAQLPEVLATPWEVLEESRGHLQHGGNLRVIRSLSIDAAPKPTGALGTTVRVLVTYANPNDNIPDLREHIAWLERLPSTSDQSVEVRTIEFTDIDAVRKAAAFGPNIVYHIGHAEQLDDGGKVALRIGPKGKPQHLDGARYAELLEEISPRILFLIACATVSGSTMNPYLGISQECLRACDSVVCMQTEVLTDAAQRFGEQALTELGNGSSLSLAVQAGRLRMVAGERIGPRAVPLFTKFIPVQLARERADPSFNVAADALNTIRLRKRLERDLTRIDPLLKRDADANIDQLLIATSGVAVITGPANCGKSTTVRGRIAALLEAAADPSRYLYYSAKTLLWDAMPEHRVRQLLDAVADRFSWLMFDLRTLLGASSKPSEDDAMTSLATWLDNEARIGRRNVVILDDVPDDVAERIVSDATNRIHSGLLVVVARAPKIASNAAPTRMPMQFMTETEADPATIARTGGIPYFVAAIARSRPLDGTLLTERLANLSSEALHALHLCTLSAIAVPRTSMTADLTELTTDHLLIESGGRVTTPEVIRDIVLPTIPADDATQLHAELYDLFLDASQQEAAGPIEAELATTFQLEAMHQALEISRFKDARELGKDLHEAYLGLAGNAVAAKAMWDRYREAANINFEPETDAYYADALAGVGRLEAADDRLDEVIGTTEHDDLHARALLQRSNVVKRLGGEDAFAERVALLTEARELATELVADYPEDDDLRELLANVEQSLGNTYGYGAHADIAKATYHLGEAARIFDDLYDLRGHRARAEEIEIRRYNSQLSEQERRDAIVQIRRQLDDLVTRSMRRDAVLHLYELGRLETNPKQRAVWFRQAFERAAGSFSPLDLHAQLQWKLAEMKAGQDTESEVVAVVKELERWREDSWSLRLRRNALCTLADRAAAHGEQDGAMEQLREALAIARQLEGDGESRGDRQARLDIEAKLRT